MRSVGRCCSWARSAWWRLLAWLVLMMTAQSSHPLWADSEMPPFGWVKTSSNRRFLFRMAPGEWRHSEGKQEMVRDHHCVAYAVDADGQLKELWRSKGWYTFQGWLADDGRHFVRMGPWAGDQEHHTDLAVAFYKDGRLLREYQVRELLKDASLAENSVSHYTWQPEIQTKPPSLDADSFHLVMIDKTAYTFDVTTGKVLATSVDTGAKSSREISTEKHKAEAKRGEQLYAESAFKKDYDAHFTLAGIEADDDGKISNVWFKEPEWRADLQPRKTYALPCEVEAVFPIGTSAKVEVSISPAEIDAALLAALDHPFVKRCIADKKAVDLRLRITGDRLHWDSKELQEHLAKVLPGEQNLATLRPWAEVILTSAEHNYTSFYLNTHSGHLIREDDAKWPWELVLLDAMGVRVEKR